MRPGVTAVVLIYLIAMAAAACGTQPSGVSVERMDALLTVLPDGAVQAEERLTVRFGDRPVTEFRRHTPVWRHDGASVMSATMDGAAVARGDGPGRMQVGPGRALDVRWTFAPAADTSHTFTVTYRAANAIGISGIRGTVSWRALAPRDYDVSAVTVTLALPESAVLLQDPWVEEAGWDVFRLPHGLTAKKATVSRGESATAGAEFTVDAMNLATPLWQYHADRADEFLLAFVSAGLFILVIGAGVLAMLRLKHPPTPDARSDPELAAAARDLRRTAWVVLIAGVAAWVGVAITLQNFGIWPLAIPASMLIVAAMFFVGAAYFTRRA
jgi:hypothetical protein